MRKINRNLLLLVLSISLFSYFIIPKLSTKFLKAQVNIVNPNTYTAPQPRTPGTQQYNPTRTPTMYINPSPTSLPGGYQQGQENPFSPSQTPIPPEKVCPLDDVNFDVILQIDECPKCGGNQDSIGYPQ